MLYMKCISFKGVVFVLSFIKSTFGTVASILPTVASFNDMDTWLLIKPRFSISKKFDIFSVNFDKNHAKMMVWTKNPDLETKMMILIKKIIDHQKWRFWPKIPNTGEKVYISSQKLQFLLCDHFWSKMWIFWFEIHEWLSTFIQILSENFRFSSELMIDYTLFVCLYFGVTHDFFAIMQIFRNFSWEFFELCGSLTKFLKIFENFTAEIGFWPQESQFLFSVDLTFSESWFVYTSPNTFLDISRSRGVWRSEGDKYWQIIYQQDIAKQARKTNLYQLILLKPF